MSAKDEIAEMLDSMEKIADDELFTEPPEESQKPDEPVEEKPAPATESPKEEVDEGPKTEPPATSPPSEESELAKLKAEIAELKALQGKPKDEPKATPPATDPPVQEKNFLDGIDLDDLRDDPVALNKLLNKIYTQAIHDSRDYVKKVKDETFETLPTKVTQQLEVQRTLQQLTEKFYEDNPDLVKFKKVVSTVFDETATENPGMKIPDILRKVGEETRNRLDLKRPDPVQKDPKDKQSKGDAPPLPRRKGGRVPNPKPAEPGSIRSQIEEMNKTLGRNYEELEMLEPKVDGHAAVVDTYHNPQADYEMSVRDYVLRPLATPGTGAFTVTLPPVAEAKGRWYSIIARQADAANTITIEDNNNDSECWLGDIVFDGKCDRALLYSDGLAWHPIGNPGAWPGMSTTAAPGTSQAPTTLEPTARSSTAPPTTTLTTAAQ